MNPRNPFYVLEVAAAASPGEIERQGRKLLALLDVGAAKARSYRCPLGTFARDATMVREAMAALRDPPRRARFFAPDRNWVSACLDPGSSQDDN